jgi:outer membrane autotransporter protein
MARKFVNKNVAKRGISRLRRERKAPVAMPVDHRRGALFGSVSALVLGIALLAVGDVRPAAAFCGESGTVGNNIFCGPGGDGPILPGGLGPDTTPSGDNILLLGADIFPNASGVAISTIGGDDNVFVINSDVWGDINLGGGDDLLVVAAFGGFPGDDVFIFGDVNAGAGDDILSFNSFGSGADIFVGEINGEGGNDQIYLNADFDGEIRVFGGISGGGAGDVIDLDADRGGEIHLFDDITGDGGADDISAYATRGGLIRGEDIWGGDGADEISLVATRGGEVDFDHLGGGDGADEISAFASRGGRIEIDQGISGGDGQDDILLAATRGGEVHLDNDIWAGNNDDFVGAFASRGGLVRGEDIWGGNGDDVIVLGADRGGEVDFDHLGGGDGNDAILAFADRGGEVEIDQGISGGNGQDFILLAATRGGEIILDDDITGGDNDDFIGAFASRGGLIRGEDIYGGNGGDLILLGAERGGEVDFDEVNGGDGGDAILAFADRGGRVEIDQGVYGANGQDFILLGADRGGDVVVGQPWADGDVSGGNNDDIIGLVASRGGDITVWGDVDGDDGDDIIGLVAFDGGDIFVADNVEGGNGNDFIALFATGERSDIEVDEDVEGNDGNDNIAIISNDDAEIRINDDVEGNDGEDNIALIASRGGNIYVDGEVRGGNDDDNIFLLADRGGFIDIDQDIEGNDGDDNIVVIADRGGEVTTDRDIEGNDGDDFIFLFADRGGEINADDVSGGEGDDFIGLVADRGGDINVGGDVSGGEGDDFIGLLALNSGDINVDGDVEGNDGDDVIAIAAFDTNSITIGEDIEGNDDDDLLLLVHLNNVPGDTDHNFNFDGEVDGGSGFDVMVVAADSDLRLDDVERWQQLYVVGNSRLDLTGDNYEFDWGNNQGLVYVDGTSVLRLSDRFADLETDTFVLDGGEGYDGAALDVGEQYALLQNPGGMLDLTDTGSAFVEIGSNSNPVDFFNYGTINLHDDDPTDTLVVHGDYEGPGILVIDTVLGDSNSDTDLLAITDDVEDDTRTTIYVDNAAPGNGTFTGLGDQDGIKVVYVGDYSATDAFQLGVNANTGAREVIDGAFSYRLFQSVTDGDWYLRSDLQEGTGTIVTASSAAQRHFYAGIDTLYKRLGELKQQDALEGRNADLAVKAPAYIPAPQPKWQAWIRGGGSDLSYEVDKGWDFDQTAWGLQGGADYTFDYNASRISIGAFGGYGWSKADVNDTFFYGYDKTNLDIDGWNAGIYATFREVGGLPGTGWYVDLVGKVDVLDVDMNGDIDGDGLAFKAQTDATAWGGSAEVGYGFDLGNGFVVQPQGQLTYVNVSQDSYTTSTGIEVSPDDADSLVGRLGVQLQTTVAGINGQSFTPWAVFNVLSEFSGDNRTNVAGLVLASDIGGTWYNAGAGFNAAITENVALYGSGEYNFGDVEGWAGTAGVKVRW